MLDAIVAVKDDDVASAVLKEEPDAKAVETELKRVANVLALDDMVGYVSRSLDDAWL